LLDRISRAAALISAFFITERIASMLNTLRRWFRSALPRTIRRPATRRPQQSKLLLEFLEDRVTPSSGAIGNAVPPASWDDPNFLVSNEALASSNAHALFIDAELNPAISQTPGNPTGAFYITLPTDIPGSMTFQGDSSADAMQTAGGATATDDGSNTILFTPDHGISPPVYNFVVKSNTGSADIYTVHIREAGAPTQPTDIMTLAAPPAVTLPGDGSTVTLTDTATLSSPNENLDPTGTITFTLTDNGVAVPAATQSVAVTSTSGSLGNGFGDYTTPTGYTLPNDGTTVVGTYVWSATYTSNNGNYDSATDDGVNETTVVSPATPTIVTQASATLGFGNDVLNDSAVLSGGYHLTGGTIHFTLDTPGGTLDEGTVNVTGDATYNAPSVTVTGDGTYTWHATFTPAAGDGNNLSATDQGGSAEQVTISQSLGDAISTSASQNGNVVGSATITDTATLSGADFGTGTITFTLIAPDNSSTTFTPVTVHGSGQYNAPTVTATQVGTYQWVAAYSGDVNYAPVSTANNDPAEQATVVKATPSISTAQEPASALVGTPIADQATVSGGYNVTGTVTFKLYNNPNGTGTPLFTDANEPLVGGVATSASFTPMATGTDYWVATYNGNGTNNSVSSGLADEGVLVFGGGLTPGFWRANADNYGGSAWKFTSYTTTTKLSSVFNLASFSGIDTTFQGALDNYSSLGTTATGAAEKLMWEATAALLNATYNYNGTTVGYPLTTSQIISEVNAALASGNRDTIVAEVNRLDDFNNLGFGNGITQKTGKPA
jgi:hypothetical protein